MLEIKKTFDSRLGLILFLSGEIICEDIEQINTLQESFVLFLDKTTLRKGDVRIPEGLRIASQFIHKMSCEELYHSLTQLFDASAIQGVRDLRIVKSPLAVNELPQLGDLGLLKSLGIFHHRLEQPQIDWISKQKNIQELIFSDSNVDDNMFAYVSGNNDRLLRGLTLMRSPVLFEMKLEATYPSMRYLMLHEVDVADESVDNVLEMFPNLDYLNVTSTKLSFSGAKKLRDNLPLVIFDSDYKQLTIKGIPDFTYSLFPD